MIVQYCDTTWSTSQFHLVESVRPPRCRNDREDVDDVDGLCSWIGLQPITTLKGFWAKSNDAQELPGPIPEEDMLEEDDYLIWADSDPELKIRYAAMRKVWEPPCQDETGTVWSDTNSVRFLRGALEMLSVVPLKQRETIVSFKSRWVPMDETALAGLLQSLPHLKELEVILPTEGDVQLTFEA
jgi:hypothetical protein